MSRKSVPRDIQTSVLVSSRRRCCICFGLDRDIRLAVGQIAHLDGNRDNNKEDNLAFLCLVHHDEYDSRTSQRKGLTIDEVKAYRAELIGTVNREFTQQVHFGELKTPPADPYAGDYVRVAVEDGAGESAEISLTPLPDSYDGAVQYFVRGLAFWGTKRAQGPHLGTLEFVGEVTSDRRIVYARQVGYGGKTCVTMIHLLNDGIIEVREENWLGEYGMNVNFVGFYRRHLAR